MRDKGIKIRDTLKQHILNNKKEYIVVMLFFLVGIFLGVFFVNNIQETQRMEISSYYRKNENNRKFKLYGFVKK